MKNFFSQHIIGYCFLVLVTIVLSGCVTSPQVTQDSKVDLTYTVTDPLLEQVIASGEKKDLMMDSVSMQLVHLLSGAKKGAVKFGLLTDPFLEYNYDLFYKQSAVVLREMGIPLEIGKVIDKKGSTAVITQIVNEDGLEQAVLDENPRFTREALEWSFTITEIK